MTDQTDKRQELSALMASPEGRKAPRMKAKDAPNVAAHQNDAGEWELKVGDGTLADARALATAMGMDDALLFGPLLSQLGNATANKAGINEGRLQFAVAFIKSLEPKNSVEALLAAQMAAAHVNAMDCSRRLLMADNHVARDAAERAMNKLMRTFTAQMDAMKRYRQKAQQVVRVERVVVSEGGQAIVGAVNHGGGDVHE